MDSLTVPGNIDSLDKISAFVLALAKDAKLTQKDSYRLRLAVDEIATNIITHGYKEAGLSGKLTIKAFIKINKIIVQLEDCGQSFNPTQLPCQEKLKITPEQWPKEGGLGIFLALSSIDHFYYQRIKSMNRSTFIIYPRQETS
jgi:serine/threonine-protein kinase RsbW